MSENSRSLHFWKGDRAEIRGLIQGQNAIARIVAGNSRWLCVVPFDLADEEKIVAHAPGLLMKWSYYDDYALGLEFYRTGQSVGESSFIWGTELAGQAPAASIPNDLRSELHRWEALSPAIINELDEVATLVAAGTATATAVRDRVAAILGLAAYEWLSPEICMEVPIEIFRAHYPDAEDVEG